METIDLVNYAYEKNPSKFQDAFNSLIADRVVSAIDAKRIEVAQSYFAASSQETKENE